MATEPTGDERRYADKVSNIQEHCTHYADVVSETKAESKALRDKASGLQQHWADLSAKGSHDEGSGAEVEQKNHSRLKAIQKAERDAVRSRMAAEAYAKRANGMRDHAMTEWQVSCMGDQIDLPITDPPKLKATADVTTAPRKKVDGRARTKTPTRKARKTKKKKAKRKAKPRAKPDLSVLPS